MIINDGHDPKGLPSEPKHYLGSTYGNGKRHVIFSFVSDDKRTLEVFDVATRTFEPMTLEQFERDEFELLDTPQVTNMVRCPYGQPHDETHGWRWVSDEELATASQELLNLRYAFMNERVA
jgi:hypothetical protein